MTTTAPDPTAQAGEIVERVARAIGLNKYRSHKPPVRWPSSPQDTLSARDGTMPLTWDFAEQCRTDARAAITALSKGADDGDRVALVERLRAPAYWMSGSSEGHEGDNYAPAEAATLIEQQAARIAELEEGRDQYASLYMDRVGQLNIANSERATLAADNARLRAALHDARSAVFHDYDVDALSIIDAALNESPKP